MTAVLNDDPQTCPTCGHELAVYDDVEFSEFWAIYPARPGKRKLYRTDAETKWKKLPVAQRTAAMQGARNLAKAVADGYRYPIDAKRFLVNRRWEDWLENAPAKAPDRPSWVPAHAVPDGFGGWQV